MNAHQLSAYNQNNGAQLHKSILNDESNVIKLIRIFRSHESLWNPNCESYRNLSLKENLWQSIAEQFGRHVSADQVKRKVKGLRNCFSTERSRVQKSLLDGRGEIYVPTLYYYKEFEFLQGITKGLGKGGNIKADFTDDYDEHNSPCDESMFNTHYTENNNEYATNDAASAHPNEDMKIFEPIVLNKSEYDSPPHKKIRNVCATYSTKSMEMKYAAPHPHPPPALPPSANATQVQSLCEMIRVDLQNVSEELFYDAKWKIMDILREVHKQHLEEKRRKSTVNNTHATSSRSPLELADTSTSVVENQQYSQP